VNERGALAAIFWAGVAWSAVRPFDAADYRLEIATPVVGFLLLWCSRKRFAFTPLAYRLMLLEALVLIVGPHYTHERVPAFDWILE
jgi:putative membrane protein